MIDDDDINQFVPSVLNPRALRKNGGDSTFLTQNSIVSRCSLSLKRNGATPRKWVRPVPVKDKENSQNQSNTLVSAPTPAKQASPTKTVLKPVAGSLGFSAVEDLLSLGDDFMTNHLPPEENCRNGDSEPFFFSDPLVDLDKKVSQNEIKADRSVVTVSSATELEEPLLDKSSDSTVIICENDEEKSIDQIGDINDDKPLVSLSFGFKDCENVNISTSKVDIRKVSFTHKDNHVIVDCYIVESSKISMDSDTDENMTEEKGNTLKRPAVSVNLEIKKKRLLKGREDATEDTKLLILKTDAIEKVTHVIVQPPNYKLVKRKLSITAKSIAKTVSRPPRKNANFTTGETLKQAPITAFFKSKPEAQRVLSHTASTSGSLCNNVTRDEAQEMNKNLSVYGALKSDQVVRSHNKNSRNELNLSPRSTKLPLKHEASPKRQASGSEAHSACLQMARNNSGSSYSPAKKTGDSTNASASTNSKSKTAGAAKSIPHHKIVAGTHFAVDAFSYGEIPNVKNYFLTHFHSDHYTGLKKTFSKTLFCSKITADLCMTRLGVNPKCIHVLKMDECVRVDSVEVLAVDANHCPGAVMLIFTLPNGRTILHTGDFRASPVMESYPIFWNKDIYSIYLDTTYCNPRYDFPTQDQSLDMALYLLRQKKVALEKIGKKFSSVLIVCGTYTIGKEKFFLGMARRVGCSVWACPEKDRVLQAVEGRSFSHAPSVSCQLHVVPMRDLTYDKLRSYLESLQGAFSEVVAFKPSGWENGKNSTVERDHITIYGIPYSEHSSFSEMIRFVKFIKPKKVLPTVDISGGIKAVQKYFPCPLVYKEDVPLQSRMTDFSFSIHPRQPVPAVT